MTSIWRSDPGFAFLAFLALWLLNMLTQFAWNQFRVIGGKLLFATYWILSALAVIDEETSHCRSRNGGIWEKYPARLTIGAFFEYKKCLGRFKGSLYQDALGWIIVKIGLTIYLVIYLYPFFVYLVERFVVTKPVGLGQMEVDNLIAAAVADATAKAFEEGKDSLSVKIAKLEEEIQWCMDNHSHINVFVAKHIRLERDKLKDEAEKSHREHDNIRSMLWWAEDRLRTWERSDVAKLTKEVRDLKEEADTLDKELVKTKDELSTSDRALKISNREHAKKAEEAERAERELAELKEVADRIQKALVANQEAKKNIKETLTKKVQAMEEQSKVALDAVRQEAAKSLEEEKKRRVGVEKSLEEKKLRAAAEASLAKETKQKKEAEAELAKVIWAGGVRDMAMPDVPVAQEAPVKQEGDKTVSA